MNRMLGEDGGAGLLAETVRHWVMNPQVRALTETSYGPVLRQGKNTGGARKLRHVLKLERLGHAPRFPTLLPRQGAFFEQPDCESRAWQRSSAGVPPRQKAGGEAAGEISSPQSLNGFPIARPDPA